MLTSNVSQDRTIPYWDEIRNLSIEDKYSLIAKIESSLGDVDMSESTNSIHGIPREVMIAAAEYALKENRAGRCIPNSQVESFIKAKRGWKQFGQTWAQYSTHGIYDARYTSWVSGQDMVIRHLLLAPNRVYYLIDGEQIVIMGIVHVKRSPQAVTSMIKRFLEEYDKQVSLQKIDAVSNCSEIPNSQ